MARVCDRRTGLPRAQLRVLESPIDAITFASPSAVDSYCPVQNQIRLYPGCLIACIGPTTSQRARQLGLSVDVVPREYNVSAMVNELTQHFTIAERSMDDDRQPVDHGYHPMARPRRLRHSAGIRRMLRQIRLHPSDLIYPIFVTHGQNVRREIDSMPGQFQLSVDELSGEANQILDLGIPAVMLFGLPAAKDEQGSEAFDSEGIIQRAIGQLKAAAPELVVITDVCLCEYTSHGHCGIVNPVTSDGSGLLPGGYVLNDETLVTLGKIAVSQAECGADIVAPSGMMDSMVASIRRALNGPGFQHVAIMSYSKKYSSAFYGPFRDAADGTLAFGDRARTRWISPNPASP